MDIRRCVLIEHTPPTSPTSPGAHVDWMIEPPQGAGDDHDARTLVTFRTLDRIDAEGAGHFEAVRIVDHRADYLDVRALSCDRRGEMRRLARGEVRWVELGSGAMRLAVRWEAGAWRELVGEAMTPPVQDDAAPSKAKPGERAWTFRTV